MLLSNSSCSRNRFSKPESWEETIDPPLIGDSFREGRLISRVSLIPSGGRVGESGAVATTAAVGEDGLPLPFTEPEGNRTVGDEEKPSEIPWVMGSVADESTLDDGIYSGIEGPLSLGRGGLTPRSASSSALGRLPSPYEDLIWLECLCDASPLSQDGEF
jgi:hypothetical protein